MNARTPNPLRRPLSAFRDLIRNGAGGGLALMASAVLALIIANSPLAEQYRSILELKIGPLSILHWINDGLMAVFFLLVGLEIKREVLDGQLRTWPNRALPGLAAFGGMIVPAAIYAAVNLRSPGTINGWAIPAATDIAFALGVLALLGPRVPVSLKVFLTALAILDDLGAVLVIALLYTADVSIPALGSATLILVALYGLNRYGVTRLWPYLALGALLWVAVLLSGVHATVAGVLLALTIPLRRSAGRPDDPASPLHLVEHAIQPWTAFFILPVFGFANAGVSFAGVTGGMLLDSVPLGIALGLVLGKQAGVFGFAFAAVKLGWAKRPPRASWLQLYGVSVLCGVGFTMSLFIGMLAFPAMPALETSTKIGVLIGSVICMITGALVLRLCKSSGEGPSAS